MLLRDRYELSGTIGLHYTERTLAIEGEGTLDGESVAQRVRESASVAAPLPVIGVRGLRRLTGAFWLDASASFLARGWQQRATLTEACPKRIRRVAGL